MSIAPPSDIILDVAQAGDPLKVQVATSKLVDAAKGAAAAPVSFDDALTASARTASPAPALPSARIAPATFTGQAHPQSKQAATDQKFEAMVLQNFIQNILPKDTELFGDKASADMCRSLLAEQLSNQLAKSSKLGIAKSLEKFQERTAASQADAAALLAAKVPHA